MYLKSNSAKNNLFTTFLFTIIISIFWVDCSNTSPSGNSSTDAEIVELKKYETIVSYKEHKLSNPQIIRINNNNSHLFIYDAAELTVFEFNNKGDIINEYGKQGRGPGEFLNVNNIFLTNDYLYVIDPLQFRITRFKIGGNLVGTMNYGRENRQSLPPPAPLPLEPRAKNINNQPAITENDHVLLSNIYPGDSFDMLYSLVDWGGDRLGKIGDIPKDSDFSLDYDAYSTSIEQREIPNYYRPHAFPISNQGKGNEIYIVYSAFPKIAKYEMSGKKIWETNTPESPELDSLTTNFFEKSENILEKGRGRVALNKYVSGISGPDGHLYLGIGKNYFAQPLNRLWIHEFDSKGDLVRRYKLESKNINLSSIFDINFSERRIFAVTEKAEIRAYPF
ncbi:6-bladed beta-propeller protein [Fodinibius salinus]|uniref:6-bladed beta-propeller protein n=1 Tax=Fodinibius salinus TaxID=860790 RepID=A0A5D3YP28_9BACT|nr:6-bladed beta-propeller [Fodinibius salinus]TYP95567.1 6-bladed beta-propeller protein [Fodinibius salinus]